MNELMRRRRPLMVTADAGVPITSLTPGVAVYATESGTIVPFIYLGLNSSDNACIMRAFCLTNQIQFNTAAAKPEYSGSNLDNWLRNTIRTKYTRLQKFMTKSAITYGTYDNSHVESVVTIERDIYVPSFYEVTGSGIEGGANYLPVLKTYKNTTNNNTARNANNTSYWLRSEFSSSSYSNRVNIVEASGNCTRNQSFQPSNSVSPKARPIISLLATTPIFEVDGKAVVGGV